MKEIDINIISDKSFLSYKEETVMNYIWRLGRCSIKDIQLSMDVKPVYTTLASILVKLERKGFVEKTKFSNKKIYYSVITKREYIDLTMTKFIVNFYNSSYKEVVLHLYDMGEISIEDLKNIYLNENGVNSSNDRQ